MLDAVGSDDGALARPTVTVAVSSRDLVGHAREPTARSPATRRTGPPRWPPTCRLHHLPDPGTRRRRGSYGGAPQPWWLPSDWPPWSRLPAQHLLGGRPSPTRSTPPLQRRRAGAGSLARVISGRVSALDSAATAADPGSGGGQHHGEPRGHGRPHRPRHAREEPGPGLTSAADRRSLDGDQDPLDGLPAGGARARLALAPRGGGPSSQRPP